MLSIVDDPSAFVIPPKVDIWVFPPPKFDDWVVAAPKADDCVVPPMVESVGLDLTIIPCFWDRSTE